jgi:hypothetical protein
MGTLLSPGPGLVLIRQASRTLIAFGKPDFGPALELDLSG